MISKFKKLRLSQNMTRSFVAQAIGVSINSVVNWDIGGGFSDENLKKLCSLFNCEVADLI